MACLFKSSISIFFFISADLFIRCCGGIAEHIRFSGVIQFGKADPDSLHCSSVSVTYRVAICEPLQ